MSEHSSEKAFLAAALRELRLRSGNPSLADLVRLTRELNVPMARTTIQEKLRGTTHPSIEQMLAIVHACVRHADRAGLSLPTDFKDDDWWREHWFKMRRPGADSAEAPVSTVADRPEDASDGRPSPGAALPVSAMEQLLEAFLQLPGMRERTKRDLYIATLIAELGYEVPFSRHTDIAHDVWSLLLACRNRPGAIRTLATIVRRFHRDSLPMNRLDQLVEHLIPQHGQP